VADINLRGEGLDVTLSVHGYESDRRGERFDDNWLRGAVSVEIAQPPGANFRARCDVAWQTTDLMGFEQSLQSLLADLTGVATLSTLEDQVELAIRLTSGKGTIEGRVEAHALASLEFERRTDQSFLSQTLTELQEVNTSYPHRR
jgi:hypothetical protein